MNSLAGLLALAVVLGLYFLPSIIAFKRQTGNRNSVLVLNIFLGWTFLGWVIFLAMAVGGADQRRVGV